MTIVTSAADVNEAPADAITPSPVLLDALRTMIREIGEDPDREGLIDTPERIARMYAELFEGLHMDPVEVLSVGFEEGHDEMVILKDIPFYSMCEHHFLPFHGVAHVGYLPDGRIVGLSKLARAVEIFARRPQVQERLSSQIAECVEAVLGAKGVGVVVQAEHLCMTARGVRKPGSKMVTSAMRGKFRDEENTRQEFLQLIQQAGV
jgi:GTP cyclohydrolase I